MLQGNFYNVLKTDRANGSIHALVELNPDHHIFEGHFPQIPVVPGVCMMQMVQEMVEGAVGKNLRLAKADHLKFLSIINPTETKLLNIDLSVTEDEADDIRVAATFFYNETTFFKFKGSFSVM